MTEEQWRRLLRDVVLFSIVSIIAGVILGFLVGWLLT